MQKPENIQVPTPFVEDLIRLIGNLPTSSQAFNVWNPLTQLYTKAVKDYQESQSAETAEADK